MTRWELSDVVAAWLQRLGCRYVALNPGASLRGLHDSLVNPPGPAPELLLCLHEEIAVALAHGYAKAAGRPMAAAVHDTVGLLHASMALFNAWVDRAPVLTLVGTGPLDASRRRPWIDWIHTVVDQSAGVRDWCVWADQPYGVEATVDALRTAWQTSQQAPSGPAVVALDVLLQEEPVTEPDTLLRGPRITPRSRPGPDPDLVAEAVRELDLAARPVIVTDRPLDPDAASLVVELAERSGAALVEFGGGANVPVGHPRDCSDRAGEALAAADLLVMVEVRDPAWRPPSTPPVETPPPTVVIGLAGARPAPWMRTESRGRERIEILADPALALRAVVASMARHRRPLSPAIAPLAGVRSVPADAARRAPFHPAIVGTALRRVLRDTPFLVANGRLSGWARSTLRYRPGQFLGRSGGEGLGYGPGASVGAALAHRDSETVVIDLQGDGDLLYTPQALWTAAHHGIPLLVLVEANGTYHRDVEHQHAVARARQRPHAHVGPGLTLADPAVDFPALARALGVEAWAAHDDLDGLEAVLAKAVAAVQGGAPALVEVPVVGMR